MIRKATSDDIDFLYELYMHPQVNRFLLYEPMDKENFRPIAQDLVDKGIKYIFLYKGKPAGMCKLAPFTYRTSHIVYLGGLAIHPSFAGKGLGQQLMKEIIDFAGEQGYKRIELSAAVINEKAIHLYEKLGFVKEGVLRNYTYLQSENLYLDETLMSYLL